MTFNTLGLSDSLLRAVQDTGYTTPTPIQAQAIPAILNGSDVMAAAQTGTGKTAGFTLPLLQGLSGGPAAASNRTRALVLTPTRELAAQIADSIRTYGKYEQLRATVVFGGVNISPQMKNLRRGTDILVATPGRLLDLYQQNAIRFDDIEVLILDEADRMLDMGFIRDIRRILALLPQQRQNLMFSATFSSEIRTLAKTICHNPLEIDVSPRNSTVDIITQKVFLVEKAQKANMLSKLLKETSDQVLVFSRTKHGANALAKRLNKDGINADAIHGNKSQAQRTKALAAFKADRVQVLVATDIASRGIDIDELALVVNFDLPHVPEDYIHRIGRTGRAGASGQAISLVSSEESKQLKAIERLINQKIGHESLDGFEAPLRFEDRPNRQPRAADSRSNDPAKRRRRRKHSGAPKGNRTDSAAVSSKSKGSGGFWQSVKSNFAGTA